MMNSLLLSKIVLTELESGNVSFAFNGSDFTFAGAFAKSDFASVLILLTNKSLSEKPS